MWSVGAFTDEVSITMWRENHCALRIGFLDGAFFFLPTNQKMQLKITLSVCSQLDHFIGDQAGPSSF